MNELILLVLIAILVTQIYSHWRGSRTVYLGSAKQFNPEAEVTTILPLPIHAATCEHDWETLSDRTLEMPHEKKTVLVLVCHRCGAIDKTVQVTSPAPPKVQEPPLPCEHDWESVVDQVLEMPHEKKVVVVMTCRRCGQIDKTTEVTSKAPPASPPVLPKSECRHKWETEKRVILDSAYEQMLKSISTKQSFGKAKVDADKKLGLDLDGAPPWMFKKTYICVRVCSVCGEVDKTIASNFEGEDPPEEEESEPIKIKA